MAIVNLKGGVGKTTLTANLGATLWSNDPKRRVLLLDLEVPVGQIRVERFGATS